MRKKLLSIILSLAMVLTMIPMMGSVAFAAESEDNATYKISVWQPVVGQAVPQDFYSVSCASSAPAIALSDDTCLRAKSGSISSPMRPGDKFNYDQEVLFHTAISATGGERLTGNETLSINGKPVPVVFSENKEVMYIKGNDEAFSLGVLKRTPVSDIYLTGYKPVKMGTTPAELSVDETADPGHVYSGRGYYIDNVMHKNEASSFEDGKDYWMHIRLDADYDYSFENIKRENIYIAGYDMPAEGFDIVAANGSASTYPSYIEINLPAQRAQKNIYEFTIPEPKEGALPGQATLEANDDISYEGIDWYKSKYEWSEAVKMKEGEKFEAGYDYYAQPKYSWKGEELAPGSYTIKVNGDTYNGEYCSFSHLYREIDLKITVAEPKVGNTPAQTFSANSADIPISNQVCWWYFLPNAPSTDGAQLMESTDKFALGCCYAFAPSFNYDLDIYDINRIYVNGVEMSEVFMIFGPLAKQTQAIKNVNAAYSKVYGSAFTLKPTSATSRTYKSSNTKIATVSSAGKVTIKGIGTAKITITAAEDATYSKVSKTVEIKAVPKTAAVSKSTPGKRKLTVKMGTKVASTGGATYQIAYKQKGTSKWKYTTTTKQSKVISKLKKGKRYYVKVRAYKKVGTTTYYSAWSATKLSKKIK